MNETRRVVRHAATIATLGSRSAFMVVLALLVSCGESSTNATNPRLDFREPRFDIEVTEGIAYGTAETVTGTVELLLDLYEPAGANAPARPPGLLIIHGGGFQGGTRQQAELVMIASEMARRGYIAASIDYRLANPRPLITAEFAPFFEYTGRIDFAAAAVADAIQAYRWMLANTNVDPDHIFVGGGSAGSITAAHLAYSLDNAGQSNRPQFFGVVLLWGELLFTPVTDLEPGDAPFFLVHGDADTTVPFSEATEIVARAEEVAVPFEFHPIGEAGHGFSNINLFAREVAPGVTLFDRLVEFCAERLRTG